MIDDERLQDLLRSALSHTADQKPRSDLWPLVVVQIRAPARRSWFDISLAAIIALVLALFPHWLPLIAYHL